MKRDRDDDLPAFREADWRRRETAVRFNGPPHDFVAAMGALGVEDPVSLAFELFAAYEAAHQSRRARCVDRAAALPEAEEALAKLDVEIAAMDLSIAASEERAKAFCGPIGVGRATAIAAHLAPYVDLGQPNQLLGELRGVLLAERDRLIAVAEELDGRFRPPTRLRVFIDRIQPLVRLHTEGSNRLGRRMAFINAACVLVVGFSPGAELLRSIVLDMRRVEREQAELIFPNRDVRTDTSCLTHDDETPPSEYPD